MRDPGSFYDWLADLGRGTLAEHRLAALVRKHPGWRGMNLAGRDWWEKKVRAEWGVDGACLFYRAWAAYRETKLLAAGANPVCPYLDEVPWSPPEGRDVREEDLGGGADEG